MSDSNRNNSQKPLEHLQTIAQRTGQPLSEHLASENAFLGPLAKMLNNLLENPVLRQAIHNSLPPENKK